MGTNYYAHRDACPHCRRSADELHIGKSSGGWRFSVERWSDAHTDDDVGEIMSWAGWLAYLGRDDVTIRDEYGDDVSLAELVELVNGKAQGRSHIEGWSGYGGPVVGMVHQTPIPDGPVDLMPVNGDFS